MTDEEREHRIRDILQRVSFQAGGRHPTTFEAAVAELMTITSPEAAIDDVYTERTRLVALVAALCRSLGRVLRGMAQALDAGVDPHEITNRINLGIGAFVAAALTTKTGKRP